MAEPEDIDLVLAICHEVGNHLAATRLSAHLAAVPNPGVGREALHGIEALSAQAAALIAPVRSLLDDERAPASSFEPGPLLEAVANELASLGSGAPALELRIPRRLPAVRGDPALLQALLMALALRAGENGGPVSMSASAAGTRVAMAIEHPGDPPAPEDLHDGRSLRGEALLVRLADRVLRGRRGRALLRPRRRGTRIELLLPAVRPRARTARSRRPGRRKGSPGARGAPANA